MKDYQYVNPYEMMYRNMNFEITDNITRDSTEKIARQLGFMHNAFGVVAKDLIKILSIRFKDEEQEHKREPDNQQNGHQKEKK